MILSGQTIKRLNIISPCVERTVHQGMTYGLGPAGYDIRSGIAIWFGSKRFSLAFSIEHFTMPDNVLGMVCDKSTWARRGLTVQNTIIEPGWRGNLTLELTYHADKILHVREGDPIAQIVFQFTDESCVPYDGKYQDQAAEPVEAKWQ